MDHSSGDIGETEVAAGVTVSKLFVIEAQEESETPVEYLSDDVPEDGPGVLRVRITAAAARAFSHRALQVVSQGRPPCPLCGLPLDASGHVCPRQNGHRISNA